VQNGALLKKSVILVKRVETDKKPYVYQEINWKNRLIGIKGARGIGKNTLLLQHLKHLELSPNQATYWSLDGFYFTTQGEKDKSNKQIAFVTNSLAVVDEVEYPINKIPLWLFGFLY
jgi:hypothetical protein